MRTNLARTTMAMLLMAVVAAVVGVLPAAVNAQGDLSPGCTAVDRIGSVEALIGYKGVEETSFARGEVVTARFTDVEILAQIYLSDETGTFDEPTISTGRRETGFDATLRYTFHGDESGLLVGAIRGAHAMEVTCDHGSSLHPTCGGYPATIVGSSEPDEIHGTDHRDVILTGAGDDEIRGWSGNDVVCAGTGEDLVIGGPGADTVHGQGGDDQLLGSAGDDTLHGGPGDDVLFGGPRADDIRAGAGKDLVFGQGGDDFVHGGTGNDTLRGGLGTDRVWGAANFDKCWGEQMRCEVKHRTLHDGRVPG